MKRRRPGMWAMLLITASAMFPAGCNLVHGDGHTAFLGDSLTQGWAYPAANYGVFGNTTAQMRARYSALVPGHGYTRMVLLGGTNDTLLQVDPDVTVNNLEAIAEAAVQAHMEPVLCEIPPIFHSFKEGDPRDYDGAVRTLNVKIAQLAARHRWLLVDYYTPMHGHPGYSSDGVHMKRRGYLAMENALLNAHRAE